MLPKGHDESLVMQDWDEVSVTASNVMQTQIDVPLGLSFQINNIFDIQESSSRFSADLILNFTWVDPGLEE